MTREKLEQRIEALTKQRDDYLMQANMTISEFNGRIAALSELLSELDAEPKASARSEPTALEYTYENSGRQAETAVNGKAKETVTNDA